MVAEPTATPAGVADKVATPDIEPTPLNTIGPDIAVTVPVLDIVAVLVTGNPLVTAVTVAAAVIVATPKCFRSANELNGDSENALKPNIHCS